MDRNYREKNKTNIKCLCCGNDFFGKKGSKYCSASCCGKIGSNSQSLRSKNEIYFSELCSRDFDDIKTNKAIFNGWDADIILTNEKIAVLWNGVWHYKKIMKKHHLNQVQARDIIKINEIKKFGYTPYIIKDMGGANKKFVEEQYKFFLNWSENSI